MPYSPKAKIRINTTQLKASGVRGTERVGVVRWALPLRGMDAEAEPPWMGSRRGNALRTAPDPMVPRTPLEAESFAF